MPQIYLSINKKWLAQNQEKLDAESDDKDYFVIVGDIEADIIQDENEQDGELEIVGTVKSVEPLDDEGNTQAIYCSLMAKPAPETIIKIVEQNIEHIRSTNLAQLCNLISNVFAQFKTAIESLRLL